MPDQEDKLGPQEFLGWYLLVRLKQNSQDQISRSKFLKLCCVADRYLMDELNNNIGFPRYWYMYGELANEHEFTERFYNAPSAIGWEGQQYLPKQSVTPDDFSLTQDELRSIAAAVEWTVTNYGSKPVEDIKKHQYSTDAPNEFIQAYSELRWLLRTIDLGTQQRLGAYSENPETNKDHILSQLDRMLSVYPNTKQYEEMQRLYLRWDDTMRMLIEQSNDYAEIEEFLDDFIESLSKVVLRFAHNNGISSERLESWEEERVDIKAAFAGSIKEKRSLLLTNRTQSSELDAVSESYSTVISEQIEQRLMSD